MRVAYRAYDKSGRLVDSIIEAASVIEAGEQLRRDGLFVAEISAAADSGGGPGRSRRAGGRTARLKQMSALVRQLSVLVSTGTPVVEALHSLERQIPDGRWKATVADIRSRVEQGSTLSAALEEHPQYFDAVARSLIAAGESSGKLDAMLARLASLTRQQVKVRSSITGAMVYPCLLVCVCAGVLVTMLFFVLPRFEGLFETLGSPLPPTTKLLMDLSTALREYWWAALGGLIAAGVGLKLWLSSAAGRTRVHRFAVRAPHLGKVVRCFAVARVTRVLGVLVEGKVPLLDALRLTREASGNVCYEELIAKAEETVTRGDSVSAALDNSPLVSKAVTEAIRSGERSGQLAPVLLTISDYLDEDNEIVLRSLSSIVEPLILIVLGLLIGFVAVSMFLPLFDLATATGPGGGGA